MKPIGFYEGDRSEYLALYVLSAFGFTIPVPRQSDAFGVDFLVHLGRKRGRCFVPEGLTFAIQVKSDAKPLRVGSPEALRVLRRSDLPLFLGIVSKRAGAMALYSLLPRFRCFWSLGPNEPITLEPGGTIEQFHGSGLEKGRAFLGPPILEIKVDEVDNRRTRAVVRNMIFQVMDPWVQMECLALAWERRNVPMVGMPRTYATNESLGNPFEVRYYWDRHADPAALCKLIETTGQDACVLRYALEALARQGGGQASGDTAQRLLEETADGTRRFLDELARADRAMFPEGPPDRSGSAPG